MRATIAESMRKIKLWMENNYYDVALIAIIVFVGIGAFGLGRLSVRSNAEKDVDLVQIIGSVERIDESMAKESQETGNYVASRNGTKYYPSGCASANRISDENKVYFDTKEEAINSGYSASSTC
jgi:hypothetical protein